MTISECIIEWLGEYQKMEFAECAVDQIEAEDGTYAIFKTPNKNVTEYMDGSQLVTEYFQLVARKSTQLNPERVSRCWLIWKTGWKKGTWRKIIRICQRQES